MTATPAWPPKSMPRLFVPKPLAQWVQIELAGAPAHYLGTVLRLKEGAQLLLFDGQSGEWLAKVVMVRKGSMVVVSEQRTRPQEQVPDLTLAFAPVKKGKIEFLVEKAVELGVARLEPVITRRTIVDKVNLERMRSHTIEAAEQCGRTALATIAEPVKLDAFLKLRDPARILYFADENGGEAAASAFRPGSATILTGPEGGFTDEERAAIRSAPNAIAISLGPRILRAETAALAAVTAWMAAVGDWK